MGREVSGSLALEDQIRRLKPQVHVFGHSRGPRPGRPAPRPQGGPKAPRPQGGHAGCWVERGTRHTQLCGGGGPILTHTRLTSWSMTGGVRGVDCTLGQHMSC